MTGAVHDGYDDFLDAVAAGDPYYLACSEGHASLPPRRACPECGSTDLAVEPLPESGTVETYTVVHVATPEFAAAVPYVTAIVDFGPVALTGVLRGVDPDEVETGTTVGVTVEERTPSADRDTSRDTAEESNASGERLLTFRQR